MKRLVQHLLLVSSTHHDRICIFRICVTTVYPKEFSTRFNGTRSSSDRHTYKKHISTIFFVDIKSALGNNPALFSWVMAS